VHTYAGIGTLPRKTIVKHQPPNIDMRQTARESCLRSGKPVRKGAQDFRKSVFATRTQLNTLKTKHELQKNELCGTRNQPPVVGSVAHSFRTEKNKKKFSKRSEPNHGKIRMSPAGFSLTEKNNKFPNDPSKSHKTNNRHPPEPETIPASQV
jgi:hypothetical protein